MNLQHNNTSNPLIVQSPVVPTTIPGLQLQPPANNMGVSVTSIGIDWFGFTVPGSVVKDSDVSGVLDTLLVKEYFPVVEDMNRGGNGYKQVYKLCDGGYAFIGGNAGTMFISLSSSALGYMKCQNCDVLGWFIYINELGCKCRRLDGMSDNFDGTITVDKVKAARDSGQVITKSQYDDYHESNHDGFLGKTITFGSRTSSTFIRIYDKAAEQRVKGLTWTRFECEFKGDRADAVFKEWISAGMTAEALISIMAGSIDFRVNDGTANKSRWIQVDWWQKFLNFAKGVKVIVSRSTKTIEDVAKWVLSGVSSAIAAVHQVYGQEALDRILKLGYRNMSLNHQRLVQLSTMRV